MRGPVRDPVGAVLVDAGPLVALVHADDAPHSDCVEALRRLRGPLVTVWPAFTEAMYLLREVRGGQTALWAMVEADALDFAPLDRSDAARMHALMDKYGDLPMDLADAALVRVAERDRMRVIFTLDRRHFLAYRPLRLGRFVIVP